MGGRKARRMEFHASREGRVRCARQRHDQHIASVLAPQKKRGGAATYLRALAVSNNSQLLHSVGSFDLIDDAQQLRQHRGGVSGTLGAEVSAYGFAFLEGVGGKPC
jgi:hypothetical protein